MGLTEIRTAARVDRNKPANTQDVIHNRWHPDIPFAGKIKNGEIVKVNTTRLQLEKGTYSR